MSIKQNIMSFKQFRKCMNKLKHLKIYVIKEKFRMIINKQIQKSNEHIFEKYKKYIYID